MPKQKSDDSGADPMPIDLALQGGGSHGAFTWGALDRLLEEPGLRIESITGTSAGAMNAVVMASGYTLDGPAGARAALETFWTRVSEAARLSPLRRTPLDVALGNWSLNRSPGYFFYDILKPAVLALRHESVRDQPAARRA